MYNDDLIQMCEVGNLDMIKLLLDNVADIIANNDEALRNASNRGHTDTVKVLMPYYL